MCNLHSMELPREYFRKSRIPVQDGAVRRSLPHVWPLWRCRAVGWRDPIAVQLLETLEDLGGHVFCDEERAAPNGHVTRCLEAKDVFLDELS